jgi:hypothetical protein
VKYDKRLKNNSIKQKNYCTEVNILHPGLARHSPSVYSTHTENLEEKGFTFKLVPYIFLMFDILIFLIFLTRTIPEIILWSSRILTL